MASDQYQREAERESARVAASLTLDNENPSTLIVASNQAYLMDNFDFIKQRYASLADFDLSRGRCFSSSEGRKE
jgi:hypothetical protein